MAAIYADEVWVGLKARIEGAEFPVNDYVGQADGFKAVNSMDELEAIEADRVTAVLIAEGPFVPEKRSRCHEHIRFTVSSRYYRLDESLRRALRDQPVMLDRIRTLNQTVPQVFSAPQVTGPTWDYTSFADLGSVLATYSVLVEFEAFPRP